MESLMFKPLFSNRLNIKHKIYLFIYFLRLQNKSFNKFESFLLERGPEEGTCLNFVRDFEIRLDQILLEADLEM